MKKYFINQDGVSNKFWNVEIDDKTQKITFGKILKIEKPLNSP